MRVSQLAGPRTSEVIEVPDPVPGDGQVLVEVVASGVCTSDLGPWRTGARQPETGAPVRLGHEIVGRVLSAGANARGWSAGDLVTGLGGGGFASKAVMNATDILPVPPGVEPAHAIGEPVADLAEAVSRTNLAAGQHVAVVGLGFMGLGLIQLARDRAPALLVGVDPIPAARQRALDLGADVVFAPDEMPAEFGGQPDPGESNASESGTGESDASEGDRPRTQDRRCDVVLEATGVTPGLVTAGRLARPFGTLCVVGYHHTGDAKMDMDLWYKAVTIVNGFCPDRRRLMRAMSDALDLIARHRFTYAPLITHRFGLDDVDQAYELMDARADGFVKAVLEP
jgi:L-iditol 2-dehydrogenase